MTTAPSPFEADLQETADHLNSSHADSVAFVARHMLGAPTLIDVEIARIEAAGVRFRVTSRDGTQSGPFFEFGSPISSRADVRVELADALQRARAVEGDASPLTSLEVEFSTNGSLPTFATSVVAVRDLSPNLREVKLAGGLQQFVSAGGDQFVHVMVPSSPEARIPRGWSMAEQRAASADGPVVGAYYTVRSWDPTSGVMTLWMVLHGHERSVGSWVGRAQVGDEVLVWGPRHGFATPDPVAPHVFIADESGLAGAAALSESLPSSTRVRIIAEVVDPDHRVVLPEVDVTWVYRGDRHPGVPLLFEALRAADVSGDEVVWGAGESRVMTAIRTHLRTNRSMLPTRLHLVGYWRSRAPREIHGRK